MQLLTQGQWWSIFSTQRPQYLQWCARSGLNLRHFRQYLCRPSSLRSALCTFNLLHSNYCKYKAWRKNKHSRRCLRWFTLNFFWNFCFKAKSICKVQFRNLPIKIVNIRCGNRQRLSEQYPSLIKLIRHASSIGEDDLPVACNKKEKQGVERYEKNNAAPRLYFP